MSALDGLREAWEQLARNAPEPNVFTTFGWFSAWNEYSQRHTRSRRRLAILLLKRDGAIAGIAPLIVRHATRLGFAVRKIQFVESPADYNDLTIGDDPESQIGAVIDFLARSDRDWDLADLMHVRDSGNAVRAIEDALSRTRLLYRIVPQARCPFLPITASWADTVSTFSRSSRSTFRNQQSRLNRMKEQGLRTRIIENPQDHPSLMDKLIALEQQKQIHGRLVPPWLARYRSVFESLFETLGPQGWLYVALMEIAEQPIAWQLGFRCGKRLWDYSKAYDHSFARMSPGTMLVPAVLDYGFSHGYREYDFMRGEESYKMRFSTEAHQTFRVLVWNRRWISRTRAFVYLVMRDLLSRVRRRGGA